MQAHTTEPGPGRLMEVGAAVLALSVLADSAVEHFRGGFRNPAMAIAPLASAATLWASVGAAAGGKARGSGAIFTAAVAAGAAGSAFHLFNVAKRPGGLSWENLFHAAPLGAPGAIAAAGLFGLAARHRVGGRWLALGTAAGLLASSAEVGLLHFRGAFHNRFMLLPVTLPPLAALALTQAGVDPSDAPARRRADLLLKVTGALGLFGAGFHAHGIRRRSGGWKNWTQNLMQGPPAPAPLAFLGMSLAGLAALALLRREG